LIASLLIQLLYVVPYVRDQEVEHAEKIQEETARNIARELDQDMTKLLDLLKTIADLPEYKNMDIVNQTQINIESVEIVSDLSTLAVINSTGWFVSISGGNISMYTTQSWASKPYFSVPFEQGIPYFAAPRFYSSAERVGASVSVPIKSESGKIVGVLQGGARLNDMIEKVANYPLPQGKAYLVDNQGTLIAHTGMDMFSLEGGPLSLNRTNQPLVQDIMAGMEDQSREYQYNGTDYFGTHYALESNGWGVVVETKMSAILKDSNALTYRLLFVNLILFVLALSITLFFTQKITRERNRMEGELRKHRDNLEEIVTERTFNLEERVKELRALYEISKLVETPGISLDEILQGTVLLLSGPWQHPEIAYARIVVTGKEYKTKNYKKTKWEQSQDIISRGKKTGFIEVGYLKKITGINKKVFLKEEEELLVIITERLGSIIGQKQVEDALKRSEGNIRLMVSEVRDYAILMLDPDGIIASWNEGAQRIKGYKAEDIIGKHFSKFYTEEDIKSGKPEMELKVAAKEGRFEDEGWRVRKDGSKFIANVVITALRDEKGTLKGFSKVTRDITKSKKAEEERENLLNQLDSKNQELQQIVYVASHDLRSPLVNVQGFSKELNSSIEELSSILKDIELSEDVKKKFDFIVEEDIPEDLRFIRSGIEKMDVLLKGLLKISRVGTASMTMKNIDMNGMMSDIASSLSYQIKEAEVDLKVGEMPPCKGDNVQINQVFTNLLDNAIKYHDPDRPSFIKISGYTKNDKSIYSVEDNGLGIAPDHQENIFEIFHRLEPGKTTGEGLGLTIVRRILDRHGGEVRVESKEGESTTFYVSIPNK